MRVQSTIPHIDGTGALRAAGDVYELADGSNELALRLKDYIVRPAPDAVPQADGATGDAPASLEPEA